MARYYEGSPIDWDEYEKELKEDFAEIERDVTAQLKAKQEDQHGLDHHTGGTATPPGIKRRNHGQDN
jgi:hypothetical protein